MKKIIQLSLTALFILHTGFVFANIMTPAIQKAIDNYTQANAITQTAVKAKNYSEACRAGGIELESLKKVISTARAEHSSSGSLTTEAKNSISKLEGIYKDSVENIQVFCNAANPAYAANKDEFMKWAKITQAAANSGDVKKACEAGKQAQKYLQGQPEMMVKATNDLVENQCTIASSTATYNAGVKNITKDANCPVYLSAKRTCATAANYEACLQRLFPQYNPIVHQYCQ
jgi:hypothetical protein